MDAPRVFMICVNRLVAEALNVQLRDRGIELLGIETDLKAALARIQALRPNVVLVEGDRAPQPARRQVGLMSTVARLQSENEDVRVIRVSLTDAEIHIYHQEQRRLINMQDLVAAIRAPAA